MNAQRLILGTKLAVAADAGAADAASEIRSDGHALSYLICRDMLPNRANHSGNFMAENQRRFRRNIRRSVLENAHVRSADRCRFYFHQQFSRSDFRYRHAFHSQVIDSIHSGA